MATDLMKDWIVELHNPNRVQTQGTLGRRVKGMQSNCCLGVLCEVDGIEPVTRKYESLGDDEEILVYAGQEGMPTTEVLAKVLDLDPNQAHSFSVDLYEDDDGDGYVDVISADEANDSYGLTFKEIADKLTIRYLDEDEAFEVRKRVEDLGWA